MPNRQLLVQIALLHCLFDRVEAVFSRKGVIGAVFARMTPHNNESLLREGNHGGAAMAESNMHKREYYLSRLRPFYDADNLIKATTGIRRCGKAYLLVIGNGRATSKGRPALWQRTPLTQRTLGLPIAYFTYLAKASLYSLAQSSVKTFFTASQSPCP